MSICLSVILFFHHMSVCQIWIFFLVADMSVTRSVCLSVCPSVRPSVHLSRNIFKFQAVFAFLLLPNRPRLDCRVSSLVLVFSQIIIMAEEKNKPTVCHDSNARPLTRQTKDSVDSAPNLYKHTTWPLHPDNALLDDGSIIGLDVCICKAETSDDESCDAPSSKKDETEKFAKLWQRFSTKPVPSAKYQKKERRGHETWQNNCLIWIILFACDYRK